MTILIGVIIVLIILGVGMSEPIQSTDNKRKPKQFKSVRKNYSENDITSSKKSAPTIAELVKSVNSIEELAEFEKKQQEIFVKFSQDFDNNYNEKLYNRYENAFGKIAEKVFYYQYLPEVGLDTKLKNLLIAYKAFNAAEYRLKKKNTDQNDWQEITGDELMGGRKLEDIVQSKPEYFNGLLQFRTILEGELPRDEKLNLARQLIYDDLFFKEKFFLDENEFESIIKDLLNELQQASGKYLN
jgi:hypothetical protein